MMDLDQFAPDPNEAIPLPDRDHMSCCAFREQWKSKKLRKDHPQRSSTTRRSETTPTCTCSRG